MPNGWKKLVKGGPKKERLGGSSKGRKRSGFRVECGYFHGCPCEPCTALRREKYGRRQKKTKSNKPNGKVLTSSTRHDIRKVRGKVPDDKMLIKKVEPTKKSSEQKECFICADTCSADNFVKISCGHELCSGCFDKLKPRRNYDIMGYTDDGYKMLSTKSNCPFCRTPMFGSNHYTDCQLFILEVGNL